MTDTVKAQRVLSGLLKNQIDFHTSQLKICHRNLLLYGMAVPYDPTTARIDLDANTITFLLPEKSSKTCSSCDEAAQPQHECPQHIFRGIHGKTCDCCETCTNSCQSLVDYQE